MEFPGRSGRHGSAFEFLSEAGTKDLAKKDINLGRELFYTWLAVAGTAVATILLYKHVFVMLGEKAHAASWGHFALDALFALIFLGLIYGNLVYQLARAGYLHRLRQHKRRDEKDAETDDVCFREKAPNVTILVPSYKEETHVVRQTLFSCALQDYPARRVVLLIDDPPRSADPGDVQMLKAARNLPRELQALFDGAAPRYQEACTRFLERAERGNLDLSEEFRALSGLYGEAAAWFHTQAVQYPVQDHTDELFVSLTFAKRVQALRRRARNLLRAAAEGGQHRRREDLFRGYRHLSSLFAVELTSFERKQFANLSWAANKAMNLNSYIGLMGKRLTRVVRPDGVHLEETGADAEMAVPDPDYIVTLDADSLLAHDYVKRLIHIMEKPGNERVAVTQTPYTAVPSPGGLLERIAGATTDMQYIVHQGFTKAHATYWVGANALLREEALDDIVVYEEEQGFAVAKYIQDRTVIEDTESSIDLVVKGWSLYNFPERLSYSATPADFGSLLIQRRRWANGGLIILPKLLRHLLRAPHSLRTWVEGFMRVNYLTSIAGTNLGLLLILTFHADDYANIVWLPLTALPYYWLYGRDMILAGYRGRDLFRVYALNFLLIPVNLGGVFKSIQQAVTGKQIPFARTPKIQGRTAVPAGYILAGYALLFYCLALGSLDLVEHEWVHAFFAMSSAVVLLYATSAFIGLRASLEDLLLPMKIWLGRYRRGGEAA